MNLTQYESNAESAAILAFANALETLLRRWQTDNHLGFNRELKQLIGNMNRAAVSFKFYTEQFNEQMTTSMFDKSKDANTIDRMRIDGNEMIRFFLTLLNCKGNGFTAEDMETAMNRTIDEEPGAERLVGQEFINSFKMN
jgi:hypothetical protein